MHENKRHQHFWKTSVKTFLETERVWRERNRERQGEEGEKSRETHIRLRQRKQYARADKKKKPPRAGKRIVIENLNVAAL